MTLRPILFSAPMIRALLDGKKTQTRRVLTRRNTYFNGLPWPKEVRETDCDWSGARVDAGPSPAGNPGPYLHVQWPCGRIYDHGSDEWLAARIYPVAQPGDVLWVRETWWHGDFDFTPNQYKGDEPQPALFYRASDAHRAVYDWKPSIHMPRWASRLTLRVTDVRVQRVQQISEADAVSEGALNWADISPAHAEAQSRLDWAERSFASLWNSINGKRPGCTWEDDPWVIAITFDVHRMNIDAYLASHKEAAE